MLCDVTLCPTALFCTVLSWSLLSFTSSQSKKTAENAKRRGDKVKFIDLRFEGWQVVGLSELC